MKPLLALPLLLLTLSVVAQKPLEFNLNVLLDTKNKKKIELSTKEWIKTNHLKIDREKQDTIWAKGSIKFDNSIVFKESKTYNRVYREQTNGAIIFDIQIVIQNSQMNILLTDFKHKPEMRFDNLNFGLITDAPYAPKQISGMTNEEYSKNVWNLIKKTIDEYAVNLAGNNNTAQNLD